MLTPYTRFKLSLVFEDPVIQHLNHQRGILSLSNHNINFNSRSGASKLSISANLFTLTEEKKLFGDLSCMTFNCNSNNDLVLGGGSSLFKVDLLKPTSVAQSFNHHGGVSFISTSSLKFLVLGNSNGSLETFDPASNQLLKTFHGHNGLLSDLDVLGNYAATCGYSLRPKRYNNNNNNNGNNSDYIVDPLVNIYDFRMMRPLSPIPFPAGASFARFHPKLPNIIIIASANGQIQFVDIYDHLNVTVYQGDVNGGENVGNGVGVGVGYLSNLNISPNGEFITFSDSFLNLHLWSFMNNENLTFNSFPTPIEQPDMDMNLHMTQPADIDEPNFPLSSIGLPYYKDYLLSNYPPELKFSKEQAKLPKAINDEIVEVYEQFTRENGMEKKFMAYDKLKYGPRNIENKYEPIDDKEKGRTTGKKTLIPKFISERMGELTKTLSNTSIDSDYGFNHTNSPIQTHSVVTNSAGTGISSSATAVSTSAGPGQTSDDDHIFQYSSNVKSTPPNCYTKLQIQYSRFGVEDFDFDYYNKTNFYCGLENHLDNSYVNPLLQLYRYSPIFYNEVTSHLFHEWLPNDNETILNSKNPQGTSMLSELGYLFDMMYKAQCKNVNISNFSECFNSMQDAAQLGLLNLDEGKTLRGSELRYLIINFNKYLTSTVAKDERRQQLPNQGDNKIWGLDSTLGFYVISEAKSIGCGFYDQRNNIQFTIDLNVPPKQPGMIKHINRDNIITYLDKSLFQYKTIQCQQCSNTKYHLLEVKHQVVKLPPLLVINLNMSNQDFESVDRGWLVNEFFANKGGDNRNGNGVSISSRPSSTNPTKYELLGYVCEISHKSDATVGEHNLVSFIKIQGEWYLFNDFLVMPIPESEVFDLTKSWKKPTIVMYQETTTTLFNYIQNLKRSDITDSIIYRDHFAGTIRKDYQKQYKLLTLEETIPQPGSLIAIDAEFVTLEPEVLEIKSTGQKTIIKPRKLSLARISVIRGDNTDGLEGVPFIDDYIVHTKEIDDYLTSFSGIEPGDLDPINSTKNLVTLQTAYRRLWLLLNMGCIFVGHGLYNDFRCIDLQVPRRQIKDTGEFYYLSEFKRKLSLKFLAYILLKEKVQTGNHDSIEDAHTALLLYKKYLELKSQGEFESTLYNIYHEGQQLRFKVPDS